MKASVASSFTRAGHSGLFQPLGAERPGLVNIDLLERAGTEIGKFVGHIGGADNDLSRHRLELTIPHREERASLAQDKGFRLRMLV